MQPPPQAGLAILYGSQTGNAEDMAKRIGLQAKLRGYTPLVASMDDYPLKMLPNQRLAIFVCSTTGHGQEPENMKNMYNFIRRRDLPKDCLANLRFAIYGLGDSSYAKFNYVSKILYKRLRECSASPMQELAAGDEQHRFGCDGVIYPKLDQLWSALNDCDIGLDKRPDGEPAGDGCSYVATVYSANGAAPEARHIFTDQFRARYQIGESICVANERLTAREHFQDTRFLRFKSRTGIHYEPGDVCAIYPENSSENMQTFLQLLNLNPRLRFKITKRDPNYMVNYLYDFIPDGLSVEDLVRYYLDIQSVPKRSFFEHLWPISDDPLERDKLREFASTEGQEELYDYCLRPKRSILETMMDFPNTIKNIKFQSLFDLIPPIKPRSFSIASACSSHPNEIHLIVGVVSYKTNMRRARLGLCSNFLARMKPVDPFGPASELCSSRLRYFIRRSSFKLPHDHSVPVVMIGPGLGIAPFRGFIEERCSRLGGRAQSRPSMHLYFGCRHSEKDFYFRQELEGYADRGALNLRLAFSRQEPRSRVQDRLLEDWDSIKRLIEHEGAIVYVAGNSKLPEELRALFVQFLSRRRTTTGSDIVQSGDDGERLVNGLEAANRIQYDCW